MNINLANIDFVPGQGGQGGGSSLTPEEQDALDILVDSSVGVLNTVEIKGNNLNKRPWVYEDIFSNNTLYSMVDGSIYYFMHPNKLYKLNPKSMNFDLILDNISSSNGQPLWMDNSGRMFQGNNKEIDLTTGSVKDVNLNYNYFTYSYNRLNLFYGDRGIWCVSNTLTDLRLYNEHLKKFTKPYTTTLPQDYSGNIAIDIRNVFTYKGHKLFQTKGNKTYEVVETDYGLKVTDVTGVYFPIPTFTINNPYFMFSTENGNLWYMYNDNKYVYKGTGTWESYTITSDDNMNYSFNSAYVVYDNCIIGGVHISQKIYSIINLGPTLNATGWAPVNSLAVDLESRQNISGVKHFNHIGTDNLDIWYVSSSNGESHIQLNKNQTNASSIELTVPGAFTLNNVSIATIDNCIVNKSYSTSGPRYEGICDTPYPYNNYYFKTPSGRLILDDEDAAYEFDGTQFNQLQTVTIHPLWKEYITISDGLFAKDTNESKLIKWNDTTSNWEVVLDLITNDLIWAADANTLRLGNTYKLSNTDGTYSWVEDAITTSEPLGRTYLIGQNVYMPQENSTRVRQYDESTKTLTFIGDTKRHPVNDYWFVFENELYYLDNVSVHKLNPSQVGTDQWDIRTNILYTDYNYIYIEYNNKLYLVNPNSENDFGYCYDVKETTPEVPASDGTYSLKAVRSGDQITYNWVLDA